MGAVLAFVEDPGAANFVAELPGELSAVGVDTTIVAVGAALQYLQRRGVRGVWAAENVDSQALLAQFRPSLVVVGTSGNPNTIGLRLVADSARRGISTVGVVDSPEATPDRFRGCSDDPLRWAPDLLLVPDQWTASLYMQLGYPGKRIAACGHPHYDYVREAGTRLVPVRERLRSSLYPEAPADSPVVIFAGEMTDGLDPREYRRSESYTLVGRGRSTRRSEIVIEEFLDALALQKPRPHCVLRIHPKNDASDFARYLDAFQQVSTTENALELIVGADAVVGMTTMLLVESVLLGTPNLSIVPRPVERGWLSTTQLGLTPCATTRDQVHAECARLLTNPSIPESLEVDKLLPRGAAQRAARAIRQLLTGAR